MWFSHEYVCTECGEGFAVRHPNDDAYVDECPCCRALNDTALEIEACDG